jgi:signal-transduction protein with cAMP-binding, CBS, and nucleotidyltransferase domain
VTGRVEITTERLQKIWPFAHVESPVALQAVLASFITKSCIGTETIHARGATADSMFVLVCGTVQEFVHKGGAEVLLRQWEAGEVVGVENIVGASKVCSLNVH